MNFSAIKVRIPPSPTGLFHVGTARVALYNYLFAKKHQGKIVLRFEDTDRKRSKDEYVSNILSGLAKLNLKFDEGPFYQSQRTVIYREHLEKLLEKRVAYWCFCSKEDLEAKRQEQKAQKKPPRHSCDCSKLDQKTTQDRLSNQAKAVIRFRVESSKELIEFSDLIRGRVEFKTSELADFVIAKSLEEPLYNFCVVVDDALMQISHVIRGEDHISNTPKQILIYKALDLPVPEFAHLPLILNEDKTKLSKRKNPVSVDDYLRQGYLPEALINFLALLGWNTADEQEVFTLKELINAFDLKRVHKGGAIFNRQKLDWLNGVYIRQLAVRELADLLAVYLSQSQIDYLSKGEDFYLAAVEMIQERLKKLSEAPEFLSFFFKPQLDYEQELFAHSKMKVDSSLALEALKKGKKLLEGISENNWSEEILQKELVAFAKDQGWKNGQLLWPIRVALTGEKFSPGVFELLELLKKPESLKRLEQGIKILSQ